MAYFLSPSQAGSEIGFSAWTMLKCCHDHPGFGFRLRPGGRWRIPEQHIVRVLAGEPVPEIPANPSTKRANPERIARGAQRRALRAEAADAPS
jgi:hypothetical protein